MQPNFQQPRWRTPQYMVSLPGRLKPVVEKVLAEERRTRSGWVTLVIEDELKRRGLWPLKTEEKPS